VTVDDVQALAADIRQEVARAVVGQEATVELMLVALFSGGHILLEGPHALPAECLEIYDRFYSPIGICRFLDVKPVTLPSEASRADSGSKPIP